MARKKWQKKEGNKFVEKIGIEPGDYILDFGCGEGLFSIPVSEKVASEGKVFALDIDDENLEIVGEKAADMDLDNIELVHSNGELQTDFYDGYLDMILLYDVLHLFNKNQRDELFDEFHRILKRGGDLSIYPKHTADNFPMHELRHTYVDEVVREVECHAFTLESKMTIRILHDERIQEDNIYNFKKQKRE